MARSFQIRPLEARTSPTARSRRHPFVHGERPYVSPRGPQQVDDVFERREVTEAGEPDPKEGVEGAGKDGHGHGHLPPPHVLGYGSVGRGWQPARPGVGGRTYP